MEPYKEQRGERSPRVTIVERPDKDMTVWLRWYVGGKPKYELTSTRSIRDNRSRVLRRKVEAVQKEADAKWEELHTAAPRKPERQAGPLSYGEGVELAFSLRGPYPLDPESDAYTQEIKGLVEDAGRILAKPLPKGEALLWEEITPGAMRSIFRTVRERYPEGGGYRKAEKMVGAVYKIAGWLEQEYPTQRFPRPIRHWRKELKEYWRKTGAPIKPHQPRHSAEEIERIFKALRRGEGDPRVRLAMKIGPELRGGQLVGTMRSDLDLDAGVKMRHGRLGTLQIPFVSEKKVAPLLYLNWRERLALEHAMRHGYLSDLEAAYQAGKLDDYALFPAGKLRRGKAVVERSDKPMRQETLVAHFHDLERAADVEPVKNRGWHGMRRHYSDRYEKATGDERVKDQLGGWTKGSTMRREIYQQDVNPEVLEEASQVRSRHRIRRADEDAS